MPDPAPAVLPPPDGTQTHLTLTVGGKPTEIKKLSVRKLLALVRQRRAAARLATVARLKETGCDPRDAYATLREADEEPISLGEITDYVNTIDGQEFVILAGLREHGVPDPEAWLDAYEDSWLELAAAFCGLKVTYKEKPEGEEEGEAPNPAAPQPAGQPTTPEGMRAATYGT